MENESKSAASAAQNGAGELRAVPSDLIEYEKFVADGGHQHNEKIANRESAIAAAKAAGILPSQDAEAQEQEYIPKNRANRKAYFLQRKIGERDEKIRALEAQLAGAAPNGASARAPEAAAASPLPDDKPHVNGKAQPERPKESDFKTYGEYVEALTDWKVAKQLEKQAEETAAREAHRADTDKGKAITDAHNARVDEAKKRYSDWDSAFRGLNDESFTEPMVVFIFESERGPDVTYWLAKNREELARIAKLPPLRQAAELGKIESSLEAKAPDNGGNGDEEEDEEEPEPEPVAKPPRKAPEKTRTNATKAPPPFKQNNGTAGKSSDEMPDPSNFEAYEAWSRRQAAKGVKR